MIPSFFYIVGQRLRGRNFLFEYYFKGKRTLDVGCGEGEFLECDPKAIWGVDTNKRVIDELSRKGYLVKLASATRMPFADEEFERAYCHNVIEHLDVNTAYAMLRKTARVLAPGGLLVLSSCSSPGGSGTPSAT